MRNLCVVAAAAGLVLSSAAWADPLSPGKPAGVHQAQRWDNGTTMIIIGAGVAAGVSLATLPSFTYARLTYSDYEMAFSMVMHGGIWGLSGAVAGLAFAAGPGLDDRRFLVLAPIAGFIGAVIGALAFELVGAGLFPLAYTGDPVSADWPSRLTARMLVALGTAAGVILCLPERS